MKLLCDLWMHENQILNMKATGLLAAESFLLLAYTRGVARGWVAGAGLFLSVLGVLSIGRTYAYGEHWRRLAEQVDVPGLRLTRLRRPWYVPGSPWVVWVFPLAIAAFWISVLIAHPGAEGARGHAETGTRPGQSERVTR